MTRIPPTVRIALAAATLAGVLAGAPRRAAAQEIPAPVGFVNDFANVLSPAVEMRIQGIVDEVKRKSGGEIVVVTLPDLGGRSRDEMALRIGREWKVGAAGEAGDPNRNTGTVVLVVPKETARDGNGQLKIELGTGTSRVITASEAGRIRDRIMIPAFQQRDYDAGILGGVAAVASAYARQFGFELTGAPPIPVQGAPTDDGWPGMAGLIFLTSGWNKVMGMPNFAASQMKNGVPAVLAYIAPFAEFLGGLALVIGFASRYAAL